LIKEQLEPLFCITKSLEGNPDAKYDARKASHSALEEIRPSFEHILAHFEKLEDQAEVGRFDGHRDIQRSITLT
jgi:hypothetical protein